MKEKEGVRFHYAWVILVCCCLSMGSSIGIANNCAGMFFTPVSESFGCGYSQLSLTITLKALSTCAALLLLSKRICNKYPLRIVLALAALLNVPRIFLSYTTTVWPWWVCSVLTGISASFLSGFASTIMLERWFKKSLGLALSIAGCFSGIFGIVMSAIIGRIMSASGWRLANTVSSIVLVALTFIPSLFVSLDPKEKGMRAYGADEGDEVGAPVTPTTSPSSAGGTRIPFDWIFVAIMLICLSDAILAGFISHLNSYGISVNVTLFDVSMVTTMYMVGNLIFKTAFGGVVGKFGFRKTALILFWIITVGLVLMLFGRQYVVLVGSLTFGASAAIYTCILPLLGREFYNSEQYPAIMQKCLIAMNLLVSGIGYLYGLIYERTGSYLSVMITMIVASLYSIVILARILKKN